MKINFLLFSIISLVISCKSQDDLSNPLTVKGMKLGLNYDQQLEIGKQNGICKDNLSTNKCWYDVTESVYAEAVTESSYYNNEKVLSSVRLFLYSPLNFPMARHVNGYNVPYPSIKKTELDEIVSIYKSKYGKAKKSNSDDDSGFWQWEVDDLLIELNYVKTSYSYIGPQIPSQIFWAFEDDAFLTTVQYDYKFEKRSLLKETNSQGKAENNDRI
jgi:hypothetical protein